MNWTCFSSNGSLHRQSPITHHTIVFCIPAQKKQCYYTLCSFYSSYLNHCKIGCKLAKRYSNISAICLCYFANWYLNSYAESCGDFYCNITVSAKQQNVCQKNSVWEYDQVSSAGSCMLVGVGQHLSMGRKTRLIAVLTEIHKRDRSYQVWPHCEESYELAEDSCEEVMQLPLNNPSENKRKLFYCQEGNWRPKNVKSIS